MKNFRILFIIFFLTVSFTAAAKNYYIAANGNNANSGTSISAPWQTIAKLNASFSVIVAGDSILFRRGDTFYGAIVVGKSGSSGRPIVLGAYGTGAKPVISGFVKAASWSLVSTGIYQTYMPGAKSSLNMVTFNNAATAPGRYPNADAANGGYLSYETYTGATSVTDNQLAASPNWTGAEIVVRKRLWVLDRGKITAHSGGKLTFNNYDGSTYTATNNYGYFIQNDVRTLDKLGEWYNKTSTKYLQMYFGTASPSSYTVKVSCIDTLLTLNSRSYININNLAFDGANGNAIYGNTGSYINIQNCDFTNAGIGAINMNRFSNLLIENCTTYNMLSDAISVGSNGFSNVTIRGCTVKRTAVIPGMGMGNGGSYKAIEATVSSNLLIEYNTVDSVGYAGIEFQGSNVNVRYNVVNHFNMIKDDAGGIYTFASGTDANPGPTYTNRVISNNIVMNGVGAPNGRTSATLFSTGIYLDGLTMNVSVLNNTVFNCPRGGIHTNNPLNITIRGNTSYNNLNAVSVTRWVFGSVRNLTIKNNIFYPKTAAQRGFYYTNSGINDPVVTPLKTAITNLGNIDSNIYSMINPTAFNYEIYATSGGAAIQSSPHSLEGWRAYGGKDLHSTKPAKIPVGYQLTGLVGLNKFANGLFNLNVSGLSVFGSGITGTWDNTGKILGGSLKVTFTNPAANKYNLLMAPIGAVSSAKKYVLRFSTSGTTQQGIVRAYIRKTASPYNNLVPTQTHTFGIGRQDHEFLFTAPETQAGGTFVIELEQNSGTTYIDNVAFYEATANVFDTASQLRFEYNATKVAKTISLGATYTAVDGKTYSSVTLQPFTSIILVNDPTTTLGRMAAPVDSTVADSTATDSTSFTVNKKAALGERRASTAVLDTALAITADSAAVVVVPADSVVAEKSKLPAPAVAKSIPANRTLTVNAYPNPSPGAFNVVVQGNNEEKITVQVYSLEGRLVYQTTGTNTKSRYNFGNDLMPGIYILKVTQGSNTQSLKIIKGGN